ncbi:MAG: DNA-3-methyladenine glycosylase I [Candidatus Thermoplasmatota archaeon]|nr:DNA-3-methyladenine glycosylase I [Candidatus Thermoplasmatota archaeon]
MKKRCEWVSDDPLSIEYHDKEWGVPVHDECRLFEFLVLEGAQAGLTWMTILRRRENYRKAFDDFNPVKVAAYGPKDIRRLLSNGGIIRNRLKIESAITNAKAFVRVQHEFGTFDSYIWQFVRGKPTMTPKRESCRLLTTSDEAIEMSKDLKRRGFRFVGPTICYAFMEAVGMVNDHSRDCYRRKQLQ